MIRYFKQGPNGAWRSSVRAVELVDCGPLGLLGRLHYTNGRRSHQVGYAREAIERNLASGDWREVSAGEVLKWAADKPYTTENAW